MDERNNFTNSTNWENFKRLNFCDVNLLVLDTLLVINTKVKNKGNYVILINKFNNNDK